MKVPNVRTVHLEPSELIGFDRLQLKKFLGREARVYDDVPSCWVMEDVIALPNTAALYDLNGRRIDQSEAHYLANPTVVTDNERAKIQRDREVWSPGVVDLTDALKNPAVEPGKTIYLGHYADHFGHFLTDQSSRLWLRGGIKSYGPLGWRRGWSNWRKARNGRPLMLPYRGMDAHRSKPFMRAMFAAAGLDDAATSPLDRPTIFKKAVIVENAFQLSRAIYTCADVIHRRVATAMLSHSSVFTGKKIYLSRSKLTARLRDIDGEQLIEEELARYGFISVAPETLSFKEQIEIFNHADVIAGFAGSALHTGMFSLPSFTGTLIVFCDNKWPNFRLVLQNTLKNYKCIFMRVADVLSEPGNLPVVKTDMNLLKSGLQSLPEGTL